MINKIKIPKIYPPVKVVIAHITLYVWHFLVHFMTGKKERFICNSWSMVCFQLILDTQVFAKRLGIKANAT